jgi:flagellar biosynthetic protein FlhB
MVIIGAVAFFLIRSQFERLANLQTASLWTGLTTVANIAIRMIIISALLLLLLSIPDYMFQRWQYRESLKMSVEEVKRERKELDGDPLIKSRLRRRMQEIMTRDMLRRVPEADVVITNPTHLAIALEYHRENMAAPQVTAKGEDQTAAMIRRIAEQNGVPIMENKPLARALYQETRVGDTVPAAYWEVVARILSKVMDINEKRRKARQDKE